MGKVTRKKRVNAGELAKKLKDVRSQFYFFQKACIIPKKVTCSKCGHDMTSISYKLKQFKCPKCKSSRSWFTGTFMFGAKISMRKVIMLGEYCTKILVGTFFISLFPSQPIFFACIPA